MLKKLRINKFKPFSNEQSFKLAPITLIYGPNSGGKSSIIQSLLLLRQTFSKLSNNEFLNMRDKLIDLGSYESLINKHNKNNNLKIGFDILDLNFDEDIQENLISADYTCGLNENNETELKLLEYQIENKKISFKKNKKVFENRIFDVFEFASKKSFKNFLDLSEKFSSKQFNSKNILNQGYNLDNVFLWYNEEIKILPEQFHSTLESDLDNYYDFVSKSSELTKVFNNLIITNFDSMSYIGPLRIQPSRQYIFSNIDDNVGSKGENTPFIIHKNIKILKNKLNKVFRQFEIPFLIDVHVLGDPSTTGEIISIILKDKRSNTMVTTSDVGFGMSQIIPLLVEGILSENNIICIEQPEIHLHPKLQAQLADFFIENSSITKKYKNIKNQWIIETHSETLILRIQKRIREGIIKSSDISVLYVEPLKGGSYIHELELDESGSFIDEWPDGFFDESYQEIFGGS